MAVLEIPSLILLMLIVTTPVRSASQTPTSPVYARRPGQDLIVNHSGIGKTTYTVCTGNGSVVLDDHLNPVEGNVTESCIPTPSNSSVYRKLIKTLAIDGQAHIPPVVVLVGTATDTINGGLEFTSSPGILTFFLPEDLLNDPKRLLVQLQSILDEGRHWMNSKIEFPATHGNGATQSPQRTILHRFQHSDRRCSIERRYHPPLAEAQSVLVCSLASSIKTPSGETAAEHHEVTILLSCSLKSGSTAPGHLGLTKLTAARVVRDPQAGVNYLILYLAYSHVTELGNNFEKLICSVGVDLRKIDSGKIHLVERSSGLVSYRQEILDLQPIHIEGIPFLVFHDGITVQIVTEEPIRNATRTTIKQFLKANSIRAMVVDNSTTSLDIVTDNEIFKINLNPCQHRNTCQECLAKNNYLCGFCILQNRCTLQQVCLHGASSESSPSWTEYLPASSARPANCPRILPATPIFYACLQDPSKDQPVHHFYIGYNHAVSVTCRFLYHMAEGNFSEDVISTGTRYESGVSPPERICPFPVGFRTVLPANGFTSGMVEVMVYIHKQTMPFYSLHNTSVLFYTTCDDFRNSETCGRIAPACRWSVVMQECVLSSTTERTVIQGESGNRFAPGDPKDPLLGPSLEPPYNRPENPRAENHGTDKEPRVGIHRNDTLPGLHPELWLNRPERGSTNKNAFITFHGKNLQPDLIVFIGIYECLMTRFVGSHSFICQIDVTLRPAPVGVAPVLIMSSRDKSTVRCTKCSFVFVADQTRVSDAAEDRGSDENLTPISGDHNLDGTSGNTSTGKNASRETIVLLIFAAVAIVTNGKNEDSKDQSHAWIHAGAKPYACLVPNCDRKFCSSSKRKRHMDAMHRGPTDFQCRMPNCHRKFTNPYGLSNHRKICTGKDLK
ncbi:hypothetical protein BV898_12265 [Hypsibius exemplaris]|uniref:C2H2-type domain-containing protein n=1 Tax=Hypsibius exemplaris TaxID=2072580 RepID=A0A1W0WEA0_HYPEX|nr:hypothetical protein BV898_12265 [Hypsibius exemplaris]